MIRDAITILRELFIKMTGGGKAPVFDRTLPAPDELRREAERYR